MKYLFTLLQAINNKEVEIITLQFQKGKELEVFILDPIIELIETHQIMRVIYQKKSMMNYSVKKMKRVLSKKNLKKRKRNLIILIQENIIYEIKKTNQTTE